jgi:cell division septum initiation protein DivIVA
MTASLSPSTGRIEFPILEISQAITPLLAVKEQIELAEIDWLAKADKLPQGMRVHCKSQIRAFVDQLRADVNEMLRLKKDFAHIATFINAGIEKFEASWQSLQTHNAEYERDKRKVHEGNSGLSASLRQMGVDLAPFAPKKPSESPKEAKITNIQMDAKDPPRHQMAKIVFSQIAKAEESWLNKGKSFDGEKKEAYYQQVRFQVIQLELEAKSGLETKRCLDHILYPVERLRKVFDAALTQRYPQNVTASPLQEELNFPW